MPKGEKTKSPEDPEEKKIYKNRRAKNNEAARKHRKNEKDKIKEGQQFKEWFEKVKDELAKQKDENQQLKRLLSMRHCPCSMVPHGPTTALVYQPPTPVHNLYESHAAHYVVPSAVQPYDSFSESNDSGTDEPFDSPRPVFPQHQNEWSGHSLCNSSRHPQGSDSPLTYIELGAYNQNIYHQPRGSYATGPVGQSSINLGAATPGVPSINVPHQHAQTSLFNNKGAGPSDFAYSFIPPQQPSNFGKKEERPDFWKGRFPSRDSVRAAKPTEEKNSPLTEIIKNTIPREQIPVLSIDVVEKTLSPSFDKMSVRG